MTPRQKRDAANTPWEPIRIVRLVRMVDVVYTPWPIVTVRMVGRTRGGVPLVIHGGGDPFPLSSHWERVQ